MYKSSVLLVKKKTNILIKICVKTSCSLFCKDCKNLTTQNILAVGDTFGLLAYI